MFVISSAPISKLDKFVAQMVAHMHPSAYFDNGPASSIAATFVLNTMVHASVSIVQYVSEK